VIAQLGFQAYDAGFANPAVGTARLARREARREDVKEGVPRGKLGEPDLPRPSRVRLRSPPHNPAKLRRPRQDGPP
jgi:hypothetical protein